MTTRGRTKTYKNCKEKFKERKTDSNERWREKKFCGRDCHYEFKRSSQVCPKCGKEFKVAKSHSDRRNFCSKECYHKDKRENAKEYPGIFEQGHQGYITKYWQGKEFSKEHKQKISNALSGINRSDEYIENNLSGESHWNWQGGISYKKYPNDFNPKLKREIRKTTCFRCQNCGKTQEQNLKVSDKKLEVHHIDEDKKNSSKSNLVALCTECHAKHHNSSNFKLIL